MSNKEYLDTLEMCGVFKLERLGEKSVNRICSSELNIGSLIKICSTYKKFNELEKILVILKYMIESLKREEELKEVYDIFVDILEIHFKNEIAYSDSFNDDILCSLYKKVNILDKVKYPYEGFKSTLRYYRCILIRKNKVNKARIDGIKCKIILENYGNYMTVFTYNYKLIKEEVLLIEFDKSGAKMLGKEDLKINEVSELENIISLNKDKIYMVGI